MTVLENLEAPMSEDSVIEVTHTSWGGLIKPPSQTFDW